jgi:hypothetical protein
VRTTSREELRKGKVMKKYRLSFVGYFEGGVHDADYSDEIHEFKASNRKEAVKKAKQHLENPGGGMRVAKTEPPILQEIIQEEKLKKIPLKI